MTGQVAFEAMTDLRDGLIEEAAQRLGLLDGSRAVTSSPRHRPRRGRGENAFTRFLGSGWGVAVICGVVALGVLTAIVWAGRQPMVDPPVGTDIPPSDPTAESQTEVAQERITEAQAKELASAYWDIRDGDRNPDNGFVFRIECHTKTAVTSRGEEVYVVLLRWFVDGHHWSTVDTVWVDVMTGEVIIPYGDTTDTAPETGPHVHTFGEWQVVLEPTCTDKGTRERTCPCGETQSQDVYPTGHSQVSIPAVPPTATEPGLSEGKYCSVCDKVLMAQVEVAPLGYTDLAYEVNEDGRTCTITGMGTCTATDLILPAEIDGYKVTRIGEIAFYEQSITAVRFPSSITEICDGAFYGCAQLTEITLPRTITSLGRQVFQYCTALTTATIQCNVDKLPTMLFDGCTALSEVNLPGGLSSIGMNAFAHCTSLQEITLPSSLGAIGVGAFQGCTALSDITIPSRLSILDDEAFYGCTNLVGEPVLPDGMVRIGSCVFGDCRGITAITVPRDVTQAESDAFQQMEGLTDVYFRGTETEWNAAGYAVGENVQIHFGA